MPPSLLGSARSKPRVWRVDRDSFPSTPTGSSSTTPLLTPLRMHRPRMRQERPIFDSPLPRGFVVAFPRNGSVWWAWFPGRGPLDHMLIFIPFALRLCHWLDLLCGRSRVTRTMLATVLRLHVCSSRRMRPVRRPIRQWGWPAAVAAGMVCVGGGFSYFNYLPETRGSRKHDWKKKAGIFPRVRGEVWTRNGELFTVDFCAICAEPASPLYMGRARNWTASPVLLAACAPQQRYWATSGWKSGAEAATARRQHQASAAEQADLETRQLAWMQHREHARRATAKWWATRPAYYSVDTSDNGPCEWEYPPEKWEAAEPRA
jgi:hypothetical protein